MERIGSILFEISNNDRHRILLALENESLNLSTLSKRLELNLPETSRHISRLLEVELLQKKVDGTYSVTAYGALVIRQVYDIGFYARHKDYFLAHSPDMIPEKFSSRLDVFSGSQFFGEVMDFIRILNQIIGQAERRVHILVGSYPWVAVPSIVQALNRGVNFRIIEMKREGSVSSESDLMEGAGELPDRVKSSPLVEYGTLEQVGVIIVSAESCAAFILPNTDGKYDFSGFVTTDESAISWCEELYSYFWDDAERLSLEVADDRRETGERVEDIVVDGVENPLVDPHSVQDAIDNYRRVTLRGKFNFGNSSVLIRKSVTIESDGKDGLGYPSTKIYKRGWSFPFYEPDSIFRIDGDGIDVVIDNIHFMEFNGSAIWGDYGNSLTIRNCDFTVKTGHHRGQSIRSYGDILYGIYIGFPYERLLQGKRGSFPGGIHIEDNWMHFSWGGRDQSGYVSHGALEMDPEYRPDLPGHEYYMGMGIFVEMAAGRVNIEKNWIWYANARGIAVVDCFKTASVIIKGNIIRSECYGSYPYKEYLSGIGILAQNGFNFTDERGCYLEISNNILEFTKMNYCGIGVLGPNTYDDDTMSEGNLAGGIIRHNKVSLNEGHVGILISGSDDFEVLENEISGSSYYGIQVSGKESLGAHEREAKGNLIRKNDFSELKLRDPDEYSNNHPDGTMFSTKSNETGMAHVWLNPFSQRNELLVHPNDIVLEEGRYNQIMYEEFILLKKKQLEHPEKYQ